MILRDTAGFNFFRFKLCVVFVTCFFSLNNNAVVFVYCDVVSDNNSECCWLSNCYCCNICSCVDARYRSSYS